MFTTKSTRQRINNVVGGGAGGGGSIAVTQTIDGKAKATVESWAN